MVIKDKLILFALLDINNIYKAINSNKIDQSNVTIALRKLYYNLNIIKEYNYLNYLSIDVLKQIKNICISLSNINKRHLQKFVNDINKELENKPKDNYENMTKEELIELLRNK